MTDPVRPMPEWCRCGEENAPDADHCPRCVYPETQAGRETRRRDWQEEAQSAPRPYAE